MNEANLVKRFNWLVTGDSFLVEQMIPRDAIRLDASGLPLGDATAPSAEIAGSSFGDDEQAFVTFMLPQDYDESGDRMILKLFVQPTTTASDLGITTAKKRWRAGVVVSTTAGTAKAESSTTTASLGREVHLSMSGDSHQAGDVIQRELDANSTSGDVVVVEMSLIYGSSFAAFNNDDRHRDASASTA